MSASFVQSSEGLVKDDPLLGILSPFWVLGSDMVSDEPADDISDGEWFDVAGSDTEDGGVLDEGDDGLEAGFVCSSLVGECRGEY